MSRRKKTTTTRVVLYYNHHHHHHHNPNLRTHSFVYKKWFMQQHMYTLYSIYPTFDISFITKRNCIIVGRVERGEEGGGGAGLLRGFLPSKHMHRLESVYYLKAYNITLIIAHVKWPFSLPSTTQTPMHIFQGRKLSLTTRPLFCPSLLGKRK